MTAFFVPGVGPEEAEGRYAQLAEVVDADVVPPAVRIRSLQFTHAAEEWTATVGEPLSGELAARTARRPARRAAPTRSAPGRRVTDTATVLAVFDTGDAYRVLTDARPLGTVDDSTFDNPLAIPHGHARQVRRFGP